MAFAFYATVVSPVFISLDAYHYTSSQIKHAVDSDLHIDLWTCDPDPDPNSKYPIQPFHMIYPTIIQAPNTNQSTLPATSQLLKQAYTTKKQNTAFMAFAFYATVVSPVFISLDAYHYTSSQIIDSDLHIDLWTCDPDPDPNSKHSSLLLVQLHTTPPKRLEGTNPPYILNLFCMPHMPNMLCM
jgi:hypothetical protein